MAPIATGLHPSLLLLISLETRDVVAPPWTHMAVPSSPLAHQRRLLIILMLCVAVNSL